MNDILHQCGGDRRSDYLLRWLDTDASGPIANVETPASGVDDQGFAARLYQLCLHALQAFYRQERDKHSSNSGSNVLRECLGRLYLWGEPFGVGELDKALEQSNELRDNVLERLGHIGKVLLREMSLSKAPHQPSKQIEDLESVIKERELIIENRDDISQNGHDSDEEYDIQTEGSSDSGSYDTFEDIEFTTTCLMEFGPSLEQNLRHAESARVQHSYPTNVAFSVSGPAAIYVSLVREKFKQAHHKLVERLGEANWQRHKNVREKIENTELFPEVSCSVFRPYSDFHDSGIGTTEYASSHTSFQSSNPDAEQVSLRVPKEPPEVGAGKSFQCFLCRCTISNVKNRVDWKMHVFADLRPYICTFPDCRDELAQFTSRAAWADHEFTEHRHDQTWNCLECSNKFASALDWEQHLQEIHHRVFIGPQLPVARNIAYQTRMRPIETEECPLCRAVLGKPRRVFVKHVARHMEEIALMALPRNTEEDSDESSIGTDQNSLESRNAGILATETGSQLSEEIMIRQQQHQLRNEYMASLQRQQNAQIQSAKVTHSIPDGGSPAQEPRPSQRNQHRQVQPQQSLDLIEKRYSDQQSYLADPNEVDHPQEACKEYFPESGPEYQATATNNKPFYLNSLSSQELLDFLASTPPPSPPHPSTRTEPGTPAIASAGTFSNRAYTAAESRGGDSSSPPAFAFRRGSGSTDGSRRAQAGDSTTDRESNTSIDKLEDSSRFADADAKKRRGRAAPLGRCHSCNRTQTPEWRRGPDGERTLCNACGLHYAMLTRNVGSKTSALSSFSDMRQRPVMMQSASTEKLLKMSNEARSQVWQADAGNANDSEVPRHSSGQYQPQSWDNTTASEAFPPGCTPMRENGTTYTEKEDTTVKLLLHLGVKPRNLSDSQLASFKN